MADSSLTRRAALGALATLPLSAAALLGAVRTLAADQPHMHEALTHLREAKKHLEMASADKGGHRAAAIKACNNAINHTEQGIKFDRQH